MTTGTKGDIRTVIRNMKTEGVIESYIADLEMDVQAIAREIRGSYIDTESLTVALDHLYDHAATLNMLLEREG